MLEYLQQLWDEILEKDIAFLESTEEFQIIGPEYKKVLPGNNTDY